MTGYIFDHRKELESDVWLLPPMYHRVWQWLKYMVNHSEAKIPNRDGTFTIIKPGQHATSYRHIAKGVGYYEGLKWKEPNPKTIKTILNWLETQGMISVKGNTNGTVVTIENWHLYQKETVKGNTKETLKKHSLDTNKNDKEELKNDISTVVDFYKGLKLPGVQKITDKRKSNINARIKDYGIDIVKEVLVKADKSDFLTSELKSKWYNFDWLFNPNNFVKVLEGNYDNRQQKRNKVDVMNKPQQEVTEGWV